MIAQSSRNTSSASVPAPVGGWNARDSLGDMAKDDAVIMLNWFPGTTEVILRSGYTKFATGISGQVETLLSYAGGSSNKLFAVANGDIYNVSAGGLIGVPDVTGLSNSRLEYVNMSTIAGNYLRTVNAADKSKVFDGTVWHTDGDGAPYDVTGIDTATCSYVHLFKSRIWFIERNSLQAWYLPTNALGGAAVVFPLQSIAREGGYLVSMGSWTIDAGYGVDDYLAFVTNKGEVIVYKGTDPSSASTWALVGIWRLGSPIGVRCFMKYAGDLLFISQDGVVPLSGALQSSRLNPRVSLTDKIQSAISTAVSNHGQNFGWQLLYFPRQNQLYVNVPINEGMGQEQYVMNTITKSWSQFTGWEANCWSIFEDNPYFGGNGFVGLAWNGNSDDQAAITGSCLQAFNYFRNTGRQKRFTLARPILRAAGSPSVFYGFNIDFDLSDNTAPLNYTPVTVGLWDVAIWDQGIWGGDLSVIKSWQGVNGIGYCAGTFLKASTQEELRWVSSDMVFEKGGIL